MTAPFAFRMGKGDDKGGFVQLGIQYLEGRKKPCLYLAEGNEYVCDIWPLATFASEEAAEAAKNFLRDMSKKAGMGVPSEEVDHA